MRDKGSDTFDCMLLDLCMPDMGMLCVLAPGVCALLVGVQVFAQVLIGRLCSCVCARVTGVNVCVCVRTCFM